MLSHHIYDLQKKYPEKILTAVDTRRATLRDQTIRARKPRSRETVDLTVFDEELSLHLCVVEQTVYYMPDGKEPERTYTTTVSIAGDILEGISKVVENALNQSLSEQGDMREGEARVFWIANESPNNPYPSLHATVVKQKREFRFAVELGNMPTEPYTALFSIGLPTEEVEERSLLPD
jgi:hypothetical protein